MPRPTSTMVQLDTTNFDKSLTSSQNTVQKGFNRTDEVVGRVIDPGDNLATRLNAATGNETFILAEGTHNVSTNVTWTSLSNVKLVGRPGAVINWTGTGTFLAVSSSSKIEISDVTIQLGGAAATTGVSFAGTNCDDCHVRRVLFTGTTAQAHVGIDRTATTGLRNSYTDCTFSGTYSTAIDADNLASAHISRNNIYDPTGDAIYLVSPDDVVVEGNIIYSPGSEGIYVTDPVRVTIEANSIDAAASYAIYVTTSSTAISNLNIDGNTITSPTTAGIYVAGTGALIGLRVAVNDNVIDAGSITYGITVTYCQSSVVDGNMIYGTTSTASIRLDNCTKTAATGNSISGVSTGSVFQDGVRLDNTCNYITVSSNCMVHGNVGVRVGSSSYVTITGNQMYWAGNWVKGTSPSDITISSNCMHNGGVAGIDISTSGDRIAIAGNRISGGARPIQITSGSQVSIVGNECSDASQRFVDMASATDLVISMNVFDTVVNVNERLVTCGGTRVSVTGNHFYDSNYNALEISGTELVVADNVFQTTVGTGTGGNGIYFSSASNRVTVTGNVLKDMTADGISCQNSLTDAVISYNVIYSPNDVGIYIDDPLRVSVVANEIYDSGSHGIHIVTSARAASGVVVNSNLVITAVGYGIGLVGTATYGITDCTIDGNRADGSTDGLYLDYVEESTVSGRYKSTAGDGIHETANSDYNLFTGIHTRGSTTGENLLGTNSQKALSI